MTKADDAAARAELARLEAQPANINAAALTAGRARAALDSEVRDLFKQLARVRHAWVTDGPSPAIEKEMAELDARLAVVPAERARIEGILEATTAAQRDNAAARHQHLKQHLDVFRADAQAKAVKAEAKLRALAPAITEAAAAWEVAAADWRRIARALAEEVRERDEAAGVHRDPSTYANVGAPPAFPLPSALAVPCRPRALDLLAKPAEPNQMTRVA